MIPSPSTAPIPDYLACPRCHAPLLPSQEGASCSACQAHYPRRSTLYFAGEVDDAEKARQQAIYDGRVQDMVRLSYSDLEAYRHFCTSMTALIQRYGLNGYQLKSLKTRRELDRLGPKSGQRVLDIGSGDGVNLALLTLHYGTRGIGIDISSTVVEQCMQVNPWGHEYYQADAEQLPFHDSTFDGLISMDVLEHLPHPGQCIREAGRVLRPGGWALFYAVSQRDAYTWHWAQRRLTGERIGVDCGAGHRWENFLQPDQAQGWMTEAGFVQVRVAPFHAMAALILDERFASLLAGLLRFPRLFSMILGVTELADLPLTSRGFGNGFYIQGRKQ